MYYDSPYEQDEPEAPECCEMETEYFETIGNSYIFKCTECGQEYEK